MLDNEFEAAELIVKGLAGALSAEEQNSLKNWKSNNEVLYRQIVDGDNLHEMVSQCRLFPEDEGWKKVQEKIGDTEETNNHKKSLFKSIPRIWRYAAALLVPILTAVSLLLARTSLETIYYKEASTGKNETLSVYLSDGSIIHLNSVSTLRYPEKFKSDKRVVYLEGEAFAEIAKGDAPFIVKTDRAQVEVLGTKFNFSAYEGEPASVTLVQGAVRVAIPDGKEVCLHPSQRAFIDEESDTISIEDVDTEIYTSWIEGKAIFRDERLEDILNKLSRWYNFNVSFENDTIKDIRFGCVITRKDKIDEFITLLSATGKVNVKKHNNYYHFYN